MPTLVTYLLVDVTQSAAVGAVSDRLKHSLVAELAYKSGLYFFILKFREKLFVRGSLVHPSLVVVEPKAQASAVVKQLTIG